MWDKTLRVCNTLMWIIYGWTMLSLLLAVTALPSSFNSIGLILNMAFLTAAVVLYAIVRKHRWISAILVTVALVICILTAIELAAAFPPGISAVGKNIGISGLDLTFKYMSTIFVWMVMIIGWLISRAKYKAEREAANTDYTGQFDLSGDPIFTDRPEEDDQPKKRSIRNRMRKQQESDFE